MSDRRHAAVFVDRDGTLIRDVGYLCCVEQLEILPQVPAALRLLKRKGYKVVVITNQSAVARGHLTEDLLTEIHRELFGRLARAGAQVDGVYYCPHHPTEGLGRYKTVCDCRKPDTGMIRKAAAELALAPSRSYVVGDQHVDMELAVRSGTQGLWIQERKAACIEVPPGAAHVVASLWEAARRLASVYENRSKRSRWSEP